MLHKLIFSLLLLLWTVPTRASFRVAGGLGLGSATSSNEITQNEGPLLQGFSLEFAESTKLMLGAEHLRSLSLSPMSTANSYTGVFFNYYLSAIPTKYEKADGIDTSNIVYRDIGYFVGTGFGFAQSSRIPDAEGKTSNVAGLYVSPKAGMDFQLSKHLGVRAELVLAMTLMGQGQMTAMGLVGNIFWIF